MRYRIFAFGILLSVSGAWASIGPLLRDDLSINERVQILEAKVDIHDRALAEKLNECHLEYRKIGRRATWCPDGAVVTEVEKIYGTDMLNVSCAKPVLVCEKLGVKVEL
jgi:hypothetical protein